MDEPNAILAKVLYDNIVYISSTDPKKDVVK